MRGAGLGPGGVGGAGLVVALAAARAGAPGRWAAAQTASGNELRWRLDILEAELADIRARLGGPAGNARAALTAGGALSTIEAELRRLTGQVERMQFRLDRMQTDASRRFADIEFRLNDLEGGGDASEDPLPPPDGAPETPPPQADDGDASVQAVALPSSELGDFDRAVNDVRQGRYDQAEERLRAFLDRYPESSLKADAHYWLGESLLIRSADAAAARAYLDGYRIAPRGERAPHNLLGLGMALGRLGQQDEACQTLRQVRLQFPYAPEDLASRADREADQLACG